MRGVALRPEGRRDSTPMFTLLENGVCVSCTTRLFSKRKKQFPLKCLYYVFQNMQIINVWWALKIKRALVHMHLVYVYQLMQLNDYRERFPQQSHVLGLLHTCITFAANIDL